MSQAPVLKAAVFASGGGTNFQSLLDHQGSDTPWRIEVLVTDRPGIGALERAAKAGIPSRVIRTKDRDAADVAAETLSALQEAGIQVIFLAGYLKLIPGEVIGAFKGRILNIHPALLPGFGGQGMWGLNVHRAVVASGSRITGPTVHLVDEEYDRGAILAQWPVPVHTHDTPEEVAARVLEVEHRLYALTADHVCRMLLAGEEATPLALPGEAFALVTEATSVASGHDDEPRT